VHTPDGAVGPGRGEILEVCLRHSTPATTGDRIEQVHDQRTRAKGHGQSH
jgi:hypothetical protein